MANVKDKTRKNGQTGAVAKVDTKLEVVVIPVSDVERAKAFYTQLGWRLDADLSFGQNSRVIQLTPPGSPCSVHFGSNLTSAPPGSAKGYLVVSNIEAARNRLIADGAKVGELFHIGADGQKPGLDPERGTYRSRATFSDPDGNTWILQEITTRLPGRVIGDTTYTSIRDVSNALQRAAKAHGEHEKRIGKADPEWPDWYAEYMVKEQSGEALPQ